MQKKLTHHCSSASQFPPLGIGDVTRHGRCCPLAIMTAPKRLTYDNGRYDCMGVSFDTGSEDRLAGDSPAAPASNQPIKPGNTNVQERLLVTGQYKLRSNSRSLGLVTSSGASWVQQSPTWAAASSAKPTTSPTTDTNAPPSAGPFESDELANTEDVIAETWTPRIRRRLRRSSMAMQSSPSRAAPRPTCRPTQASRLPTKWSSDPAGRYAGRLHQDDHRSVALLFSAVKQRQPSDGLVRRIPLVHCWQPCASNCLVLTFGGASVIVAPFKNHLPPREGSTSALVCRAT